MSGHRESSAGHGGNGPGHGGHPGPGRDGYDRTPLVVTWEATQACDLACQHCRADARPERSEGELSTAEAKRLIDQVAGFGSPGPVFVFSGGDPLKRPDLVELAAHGTESGVPVAVTPASTPLLTRDALVDLRDAGVRRIALSLDGSTAARHDGFRGEEGSFEIIRRAAAEAEELGLPIQINTTVTSATAADLPEIADLVEEMGAVMWEVFFLVPVGRGAELSALGPWEHEWVLDWLYLRGREAPFRLITVEAPFYRRVGRQIETAEKRAREGGAAGAGREGAGGRPGRPQGSTGDGNGFVFVSHLGEVFPSGFLPVSAGNVRDGSLVAVYRDSRLFRTLRDRERLKGKCGACEFRFVCGGSRARAYAMEGDWMAADPFCPYRPRGWTGEMPRGVESRSVEVNRLFDRLAAAARTGPAAAGGDGRHLPVASR